MNHEVPDGTTQEQEQDWKSRLQAQFDEQQAQFDKSHERFLNETRLWLAAILRRRMYEHSREDSDHLKECVDLLHGPLIDWCEADVA